MNTYYKLRIDKTARPMDRPNPDDQNKIWDWQTYDVENKEFDNLQAVKNYLKKQYFYCKTKYPTYQDIGGKSVKTGFIYAFKSDPASYDDCKHYEQHWVNVYKIKSEPVLL